MANLLFSPIQIRDLDFRNRIFVAPMCQYSAVDGLANDWHLVHLGSRAVGGAALVMVEATAVAPEGRISPGDTGLWNFEQAEAFQRITRFLLEQGSIPAIQLAHAGRKASTDAPWRGGRPLAPDSDGGWRPLASSSIGFSPDHTVPKQMTASDIEAVVEQFQKATRLSRAAGFQVVEIHMAHGYLLHEFLSPLTNRREDEYGGSLENRLRLPLEVAAVVRKEWPSEWPVFVRISATDWAEGGWDLEQSLTLCRSLKELGIDLIDCSSGGAVPDALVPVAPGFQVPFAERIRSETGILTGAVGLITEPVQAEGILQDKRADVVFLARQLLREPYWPLRAARELGVEGPWPVQYQRAKF